MAATGDGDEVDPVDAGGHDLTVGLIDPELVHEVEDNSGASGGKTRAFAHAAGQGGPSTGAAEVVDTTHFLTTTLSKARCPSL